MHAVRIPTPPYTWLRLALDGLATHVCSRRTRKPRDIQARLCRKDSRDPHEDPERSSFIGSFKGTLMGGIVEDCKLPDMLTQRRKTNFNFDHSPHRTLDGGSLT